MAKEKKALKMVKGVPYEVQGDVVLVHKPEGIVTLPLVLGQSAYAVVFSHLHNKGTGARKTSDGKKVVGNFNYSLSEPNEKGSVSATIVRKDGSVLTTIELNEKQAVYPRNHVLIAIANVLE